MSEPPDITTAFVAGTLFFSATAFVSAATISLFRGRHQVFRNSALTALNVGVAGGLFTGPFFKSFS
jgi:hypothetical protein